MTEPTPRLWRHECKSLRAVSYLSVEVDCCPDCGMPKRLSARKGNGQAVNPPSDPGKTESRKRSRGKELWPRSEAHRRAISEGSRDTRSRKRVAAALPDIRRACWNDLTCDICGAKVPDGADQVARDAAHLPGCLAASGAREGLVDLS